MILSVLTICRNDLTGLRTTVDSVLSQTCPPDEFIVLDGGSTDGTIEYLQKHGESILWRSEMDAGIADAFNKIARMASGKWLLFLNSGDAFADRDVLRDACKLLRDDAAGAGVYFGDAIVVDPSGLHETRRAIGTLAFGKGECPLCHQAAFIRRDLQLLHPYDKRLRIGMDYDLWLRLRALTEFVHIDREVCVYRLGGVSSSREWGEYAIIAHRMVEWVNTSGRNVGVKDVFRLLRSLVGYRIKKTVESLLGARLYALLRRTAQ